MRHGSLFSGIGGFDLAAEWMGWENSFHCEWNPFGQKILKHYWPDATSYTDITKTDFSIHRGTIDVLTGGFPCQPYSIAGKRKGKEDERHLWPEMLRAIREIQPSWVVGENVGGLVNWNGGMVFDEVQAQLEVEGYEVQPFILPACAVNAPHRRDRVWFIANSNNARSCIRMRIDKDGQEENKGREKQSQPKFGAHGLHGIVTDSTGERLERGAGESKGRNYIRFASNYKQNQWTNFPTQSSVCSGNDGLSSRLDGITFPRWRKESIKAGGNAIVPQVAHQIFKAIAACQIID